MIHVNNIEKKFGKKQILRDITFSANPGDCIGILGENGCGKSTLLAILAGALPPDSGTISYDGLNPLASPDLFQKLIGYVPQENPFIEGLTVVDNLLLWYPDSKKDLVERLHSGSLALFHLYEVRNLKVEKLSGGMKKRLSIACALAGDPKIFILDEPTSALDLSCKTEIRSWMNQHLSRGGVLIFSSHEEEDFTLFTHPYYMENGVLTLLPTNTLTESLQERMKLHEAAN